MTDNFEFCMYDSAKTTTMCVIDCKRATLRAIAHPLGRVWNSSGQRFNRLLLLLIKFGLLFLFTIK